FNSSSASCFVSAVLIRSGCQTSTSRRYRRLTVSNGAPGSKPRALYALCSSFIIGKSPCLCRSGEQEVRMHLSKLATRVVQEAGCRLGRLAEHRFRAFARLIRLILRLSNRMHRTGDLQPWDRNPFGLLRYLCRYHVHLPQGLCTCANALFEGEFALASPS